MHVNILVHAFISLFETIYVCYCFVSIVTRLNKGLSRVAKVPTEVCSISDVGEWI